MGMSGGRENGDLLIEEEEEEEEEEESHNDQERRFSEHLKKLKFISTEIVVFCFVFVFYYYQYYTQQYLFQWYTIKALENATSQSFSNLSSVCYNQTLMNALSGSNSTIDEVEQKTAQTGLVITLAKYLPSLFINLVISPLSDKYGRKPAMIIVMLGESLSIALSVVATYLVLDVYWFILCGFLLGFSGGVSTLMAVSFAYVSDITPEKWRTIHLGVLQAVIYIATAASAGVFNVWLQKTNCDFRPPSWLMLVIVLLGLLYAILMPESLPRNKMVRLNQSKTGLAVIFQGLKVFFWPRLGYSLWRLWFVVFSIFVVVFGESGEHSITTLFLLHRPLEWSRDRIGVYGLVRALAHAVALFLVLPLLSRVLKLSEPVIFILAVIPTIGASLFLGFVKSTWEMFLVVVVQGVQSLMLPALLGINAHLVRQEDQGAIYSVASNFSLMAALCGAILYSLIYPFTLLHGLPPGSSFWITAFIWAIPIPFLLILWYRGWKNTIINISSPSVQEVELLNVEPQKSEVS